MRRRLVGSLVLVGVVAVPADPVSETRALVPEVAHHALHVTLDPARRSLSATDRIRLPAVGSTPVTFALNGQLRIVRADPAVEEIPGAGPAPRGESAPGRFALKRYRVSGTAPGTLTLSFEGPIDFALSDPKEEYTRGFRETPGYVGPEGVYLSGASGWYPRFGREFVTFALDAVSSPDWHLISQGSGMSRTSEGHARWESGGPMDEIYLVGGPLNLYRDSAGAVEALVYLRDRDAALAGKYLAATAQYIEMYRGLIGPYPYGKFALVENFWETGYGMPTFTLLGSQIIRFPFILTSSYPHEILHNWWGNSVFVDDGSGNWCEGLTAYMADHLIQEQRGAGDEYRRSTLQKYRDYVQSARDFPLAEFRERFSAATEAVGYGKSLMGFHMLRRAIGDDAFRSSAARFYREFRGKRASFRDFQGVAEAISGRTLGWLFDDLITRTGAAVLQIGPAQDRGALGVTVRADGTGFAIEGTLRQVQEGRPFVIEVPLDVQTAAGTVSAVVRMEGAEQPFAFRTEAEPLALHVDPHFDVFRRLDPRETPPSIGQIFGEPAILAVLPADAEADEQAGYRTLLASWQADTHTIQVTTDRETPALPADRAVWLVGRANRVARTVFGGMAGFDIGDRRVVVDGEEMAWRGHTLVVTRRHPASPSKAVGWIVSDPVASMPGLGRKLPHYGKYSYLGFEGEEPVNTIKGQWQAADSPMRIDLRPAHRRSERLVPLVPAARKALAELPAVFSQQALRDHVAYLASPDLGGRGLGSAGLLKAAAYIADRFKAAGLAPCGDGGSYYQRFTVEKGEDQQPHEVANILGCLPGTREDWREQSAVLSAHYDHLGLGWPDVHTGDEGKVHPGADDNASGVAVLLELARVMSTGGRPPRTVVFAAFTGEEAGLRGSRHYAAHPVFPLGKVIGTINLDTVGRLGREKVSVLGTGTATEWPHIFRGAGFVTGVDSRNVPESIQSSDQLAFIERGVPAVQIFSGAHTDYHRPGDVADKVDVAGLVRVATFVREGIAYLAERPEPLTNTIARASPAATPATPGGAQAGGRRVSFGTVPDFAFQGPGVKVTGLVPGSPAERAGVREGDVLLAIAGRVVANLQGFSDILRTLAPGQTVDIELDRAGSPIALKVTLTER
ncbi:MAG: M20/M25/M40 family metallo-hydrolase [Acidobacteriota bacterium]